MSIHGMRGSEPWAMTAEKAARRPGFAALSELALREALELFCRKRWPEARIVHEIVMGEGKTRADVAAIDLAHIVAFEVKGSWDDTTRLLHQVGMFKLCVPEVWMVVPGEHEADAKLIRHLMPCIGLLAAPDMNRDFVRAYNPGRDGPIRLEVRAEPEPRPPVPEMTAKLLWAQELRICCEEAGLNPGSKATRPWMVNRLLANLSADELMAATCARLRARDALWRADDPIGDAQPWQKTA